MRRKYILGIDGGGPKTYALMVDYNEHVIREFYTGSSNLLIESPDTVKKNIHKLLSEVSVFVDKENINLEYICLGNAGLFTPQDKDMLNNVIKGVFPDTKILVTSYLEIILEASTNEEGVILISGVGSSCCGKNSDNNFARSGGWGLIGSDEGSSYWIGTQALIRVIKEFDGICEKSLLGQRVIEKSGFISPWQVASFLNDKNTEPVIISEYFTEVVKCAEEGDTVAIDILNQAAENLFILIKAVREKLSLPDGFPVSLYGNVFKHSRHITDYIIKRCANNNYGKVTSLNKGPIYGAIKLIQKNL